MLAAPVAEAAAKRKPARAQADVKRTVQRDSAPQIPPGQLHIMVSIRTQRIAVYSDGVLAARSNVSTGVPTHPTPTGVFSIIQKNRHHRSNIYSGAPMPFMQRLTWSGIALHQGPLPGRPASHGCIRLTGEFASLLWKRTRLGARVVVTREEAAPYEFSHPRLFRARPQETAAAASPASAIRTAQAETTATDAGQFAMPALAPLPDYPPIVDITADIRKTIVDEDPNAKKAPAPSGPISVFVSRKERKLYVRQGFVPLFETLIEIRDHDKPFGTHVFTATGGDGALRWLAVSLPVDAPKPKIERRTVRDKKGRPRIVRETTPVADTAQPTPDAAGVLERIDIPRDAIERIEALIGPGASLIVADAGLGWETGKGTDFIVLTRPM